MIGPDEDVSRRDVLETGAGIGAAGLLSGLAGCSTVQDVVLGGGDVDSVPEDAQGIYTVDVAAVLEDEAVETLTDTYLEMRAESEWYAGPESYDDVLDDFEDDSGLDATKAGSITGFSEYSDYGVAGEYAAIIFTGEWDEDDVVDAFEDSYEDVDDDEYEGRPIYEPENTYSDSALAVLADDRYVIGKVDAVEDVVDVQNGEEDSLDEELKDSYDSTRDAPVRYAGEMGSWVETGEIEQNGVTVDPEPLEDVEYVSGALYRSDDNRGAETTLHAEDEDTAEDVIDVVEGYFALVENDQYTDEAVTDEIDEIEVERDGDTVVITYEKSVAELEDMLEETRRA